MGWTLVLYGYIFQIWVTWNWECLFEKKYTHTYIFFLPQCVHLMGIPLNYSWGASSILPVYKIKRFDFHWPSTQPNIQTSITKRDLQFFKIKSISVYTNPLPGGSVVSLNPTNPPTWKCCLIILYWMLLHVA